MLSVVICSAKSSLAQRLMKNIEMTVGVPCEIIIIDNSADGNGICAVYNTGARKAKYPILCFVHEDVLFRTAGWGKNLLAHFEDPLTGLVGVAGGDSLSNVPSTWSNTFISPEINIMQYESKKNNALTHLYVSASSKKLPKKQVQVIDGVFMCVKKTVFDEYQFDESLLKNFHGYDVDYSLQVSQKYKNYVAFDILLEHYSEGKLNKAWLTSCFVISKKWKRRLPVSVYTLGRQEQVHYHWQTLHVLIKHMFNLKYNPVKIYFNCIRYSCTRFFKVRRFLSMNRFFIQLLLNHVPAGKTKPVTDINKPLIA
jgi:Glycosyltransferase like family